MRKGRPALGTKRRGYNKVQRARFKAEFLIVLAHNKGYLRKSAEEIGVTIDTIQHWRRKDQVFNTHIEEILKVQLDKVEDMLFKAIERRESWAIVFYLKSKGRLRGYQERKTIFVPLSAAAWAYLDPNKLIRLQELRAEMDQAFKDIAQAKDLTPMKEAEAKAYAIAESYKIRWREFNEFENIDYRAEQIIKKYPKIAQALKNLEAAFKDAPFGANTFHEVNSSHEVNIAHEVNGNPYPKFFSEDPSPVIEYLKQMEAKAEQKDQEQKDQEQKVITA